MIYAQSFVVERARIACGAFDPVQVNRDNIRWVKSMIARINVILMFLSPLFKI